MFATHHHCPLGHEKPQEITLSDGRVICGRCWVYDGELIEMVLCSPATCDDADGAGDGVTTSERG